VSIKLRLEDDYLPQIWKRSVYPLAQQLGVRSVPSLDVGGELIQAVFEPQALRRYLMEQHKEVSITQANA
jgi:hypothetical protein